MNIFLVLLIFLIVPLMNYFEAFVINEILIKLLGVTDIPTLSIFGAILIYTLVTLKVPTDDDASLGETVGKAYLKIFTNTLMILYFWGIVYIIA